MWFIICEIICEMIQEDLARLETWENKWLMTFNASKCNSITRTALGREHTFAAATFVVNVPHARISVNDFAITSAGKTPGHLVFIFSIGEPQ